MSCVSGGQQPIAFSTQRLMVSCALNANAKKSLRLDMLQPAALCTANIQAEAHRQTTAVSDEGRSTRKFAQQHIEATKHCRKPHLAKHCQANPSHPSMHEESEQEEETMLREGCAGVG